MKINGWKNILLGDIVDFVGGSQPPLSLFSSQKKPGYVRLIQIRDYKTDKYITYIPKDFAKRFCDKKDIMIGRYGPPIFQILNGLEGAYNVALIKAIPKNVHNQFLYYTLKREDLFAYVELLSRRTSGQTGIDLDNLRKYKLIIPADIKEQSVIADILTDTDNLISSLRRLIDKKKAVKQGAMEELLTGKRRLPGFNEDWVERRLGDIVEIKKGSTLTSNEYKNGYIPVMAGGKDYAGLHDSFNRPKWTITISASGASAGFVRIHPNEIFATDCSTIEPNDQYNILYIYYILMINQNLIYKLQTGGAQPHIHPKDLYPLNIRYAMDIKEQEAIAKVLSDMDSENGELEKKLAKYEKIKQGMMQQLLTGRIRLLD